MTIFRKWKHFVRETKLLHQLNKRRLSYKVKVVLHSFSPIFILVMMVFCQSMPYGSSLLNRFHVPFYFSTKKLFLRLFFLSHRTSTKAFDVSEEFVVWGRVISSNLCFSTLGHSRGFSLPKARGFHNIN